MFYFHAILTDNSCYGRHSACHINTIKTYIHIGLVCENRFPNGSSIPRLPLPLPLYCVMAHFGLFKESVRVIQCHISHPIIYSKAITPSHNYNLRCSCHGLTLIQTVNLNTFIIMVGTVCSCKLFLFICATFFIFTYLNVQMWDIHIYILYSILNN